MPEYAPQIIKSCRYSIWYRITQVLAKMNYKTIPSWLRGKTYMTVKYSDGTVTKVKLS